ncbi:hypothetical protein V5R04_12295 [Jonesiaceae bacterium BS-20]|uniref:Uncharacterized protein n=1 Tax=Jonesiaceae bacterium BS-20 TaxID=3120821 RepID=A0AAU7DSR9_9MICO
MEDDTQRLVSDIPVGFRFDIANIAGYGPLNYFSFFAVESNVIAAATLLSAGLAASIGAQPRAFDYVRGAATRFGIAVAGFVLAVLLSKTTRMGGHWRN